MKIAAPVALVASSFALATPAAAEPDEHRAAHASFVAGGAVAYLLTETIFKDELGPSGCRWCDDNGADRATRDALAWDRPRIAGRISDVTAFAVAPALQLTGLYLAGRHEGASDVWIADSLALAEAAVIAGLINQTVKFAVGRQRPFAHVAGPGGLVETDVDDNLSFYSGHTTLTFTLAAAGGTIAQMRGYAWAPWLWASGAVLGTGAGYLRMAADKHWLSDVALGAVLGTAIGITVPRLLHGHLDDERAGGRDLGLAVTGNMIGLAGMF